MDWWTVVEWCDVYIQDDDKDDYDMWSYRPRYGKQKSLEPEFEAK